MTDQLWETIRRHKAGEPVGVYSMCSAHPEPRSLVQDTIRDSLRPYATATLSTTARNQGELLV
jgi:hypothetical protein